MGALTRQKQTAWQRAKRKQNREFIADLKRGRGCLKCGETDPCCLDFHHRDPTTKTVHVSLLVSQARSMDSILTEVVKCDLLCANCHRKYHYSQGESR